MDGNGRWAQERGLPRSAGHLAGMQKVQRVIEESVNLGIQVLTLYAFSTENWNRPSSEVNYLMALAKDYLVDELPKLQQNGVRLQLMGRRGGLPESVLSALDTAIDETQDNSRLIFNLALNYGGRTEITDAARTILADCQRGQLKESDLDETVLSSYLYCPNCPDVDLVIRTGGEWRLSNFLLWQTINAYFVVLPVMWPDFRQEDLQKAIRLYRTQSTDGEYDD